MGYKARQFLNLVIGDAVVNEACCSICLDTPKVDEEWFVPLCSEKHMMKKACVEELKKKAE
jgi:hypothetical protein